MSALREAAQQALEALRGYRRELSCSQPCDGERALEIALEQPAHELAAAAQQALEALIFINEHGFVLADYEDPMTQAIVALRSALAQEEQEEQEPAAKMILEALEIGYDSAQAEAAQYHAAMAGYRPERHAEMDADVQKIAKAITAVKAALALKEKNA